ncbi:MAG: histidine triad nucleotide-binding protein [Rhodocyclaceae bacterium]
MTDCIFCKIARGEIPSRKLYEDEEIFAFHDIRPVAPVHFLIVPKLHVASLAECDMSHQALLGRMMAMSGKLAAEAGCSDGFRLIVNTGRVGLQEVYHLHIHVLGGPERLPPMLKR